MQNRQLQTWLSQNEYEHVDVEWQEQLEIREELKDKQDEWKRYEDKLKEAINFYNAVGYDQDDVISFGKRLIED